MPCENCNVQFTVFKRKRICNECSRFYCNQCLTKRKNKVLCERCLIFTSRPLSKVDLLKLKPKDLIFYLQSKHISTTGCVEKEELVNLVLARVNTDDEEMSEGSYSKQETSPSEDSENCSNPFDQLKQTCQNLFSSFSVKIASDFQFDSKTSPTSSNSQQNISDQPRVTSIRKIPTYASSLNRSTPSQNTQPSSTQVPNIQLSGTNAGLTPTAEASHSNSTSSPSSPIVSLSSISSQSISSQTQAGRASIDPLANQRNHATTSGDIPTVHTSASNRRLLDTFTAADGNGSGCDCSDDEMITRYKMRQRTQNPIPHRLDKLSPTSQTDSAFEDQIPGPSGSIPVSRATSKSSNDIPKNSEESSGSSFEELGAAGGGTPSDNEHWQFVNKTEMNTSGGDDKPLVILPDDAIPNPELLLNNSTSFQQTHSTLLNNEEIQQLPAKAARRVVRRRSDGFIYNQKKLEMENSTFSQLDEESDDAVTAQTSRKRPKKSCNKCGKSKKNLQKYVAKFKRQLESANMAESEIKKEAEAFLTYLENREGESFECSDSDSNNSEHRNPAQSARFHRTNSIVMQYPFSRDDDGIHVYALNENSTCPVKQDTRFINLGDFQSSDELEELSVKQLKEILMLNRVDYKGCCEKQELLERVYRLWKDLQTSPAVDKLQTDDLCKICMDAPIECVILECGHMATCTSCGKVLSECPICRQYIVRIVRFFRA